MCERQRKNLFIFGSHRYCSTVSCGESPLTQISLTASLFLDFSLFLPTCGIVRQEGATLCVCVCGCSRNVVLPVLWSGTFELALVITVEIEGVGCVLVNYGVPLQLSSCPDWGVVGLCWTTHGFTVCVYFGSPVLCVLVWDLFNGGILTIQKFKQLVQ